MVRSGSTGRMIFYDTVVLDTAVLLEKIDTFILAFDADLENGILPGPSSLLGSYIERTAPARTS